MLIRSSTYSILLTAVLWTTAAVSRAGEIHWPAVMELAGVIERNLGHHAALDMVSPTGQWCDEKNAVIELGENGNPWENFNGGRNRWAIPAGQLAGTRLSIHCTFVKACYYWIEWAAPSGRPIRLSDEDFAHALSEVRKLETAQKTARSASTFRP